MNFLFYFFYFIFEGSRWETLFIYIYLHAFEAAIPPSQRVQFILGEEGDGDDGAHESHPLFSEMEELCYNHDAGEVEWNETARSVC